MTTLAIFDDKETRTQRQARDKFAPIPDVWDLFHTNVAKHYHPGQNITFDEQLVPCRGRCSFIQYTPSNPGKYGIKIFSACDSESKYPLRGSPYLGKEHTGPRPAPENKAVGSNNVQKLTQYFKGCGRNITCDKFFFTSLDLAEVLVKDNLTMVGTVRWNKTFLPVNFQEK
ncbi:uncharacterized protein LOC101852942 [Aplysia californica]|uniref:Uncharacterized protein LOC101852942 n=1 Tax=Aplysia californica TaxID=6500 RepID=A0ABM0JWM6_APLCA|nr:uncharacterized protein LOC101852942 [Aplysia californica]